MKLLIDISHPGHVHLFRLFAKEMQNKGHEVLFTCRSKEFEVELLEAAGFKYVCFGKHYKSKIGKIFGLLRFDLKMLFVALTFKPDLFLSHGSIYAATIAGLLKKPNISMEDSGNMEQIKIYRLFTKAILTPQCLQENLGDLQIRYNSFHEIAYLRNFDIKKVSLAKKYDKRFALLRFVSWNATHDVGQGGLSNKTKEELVSYLSQRMDVYISSECELPIELKKYQINLRPEEIHNILAKAEIVVSEGATMASEAGVLGTPAIYVNSLERCYNKTLENYGLVWNLGNDSKVIETVRYVLGSSENYQEKRAKLLEDKIDTTAFLVWFVENFPESFDVMKKSPDYQYQFK